MRNFTIFRTGSQRGVNTFMSGEGAIEHPMSTHSAPFGTSWTARGWRYIASILMILTLCVGNAIIGGSTASAATYYATGRAIAVRFGGDDASYGTVGCTAQTGTTTAAVKALAGTATGGFAGSANTGTIENDYVGGRTYSGQYLSNSGDVTGGGKTGGFVGQTTGDVTIKNSYTTASVSGNGTYAGGFIGSRDDGTTINNCYCKYT